MGQVYSGLPTDASGNVIVNINAQSLGTVVVSGTITANQGGAPWSIVGNVASGASDSGDPLKTGGIFNTTQPTVTNGQRVDHQSTARGAQIVAVGVDGFAVTVSGTVAVTQSTSPWVIAGNLTNNNAAPTSNNLGVLPAIANAAHPTYTEGDQVLLSTDLTGALRVSSSGSGGTQYNDATTPTPPIVGTAQLGKDSAGEVHVINTDTVGITLTRPGIPATMLSTPVVINVNTTGNNFIIAGSAGKKIYVYALDLQISGITGGTPTNVTLKDGTTTALTGPYAFQNGGTLTKDFCGEPWYVCSTTGASSGFNFNQSGTAQLSGTIWYLQV